MQRLQVWVAVLLGCLVAAGCQSGKTGGERVAAAVPPTPVTVYPYTGDNLNFLGLEEVYRRELGEMPTGKKGKAVPVTVRDAYVLGEFVIAETNSRNLHGILRASGQPKFMVQLSDPADVRACENETHVFVVARNVMYAIDKRSMIDWQKPLEKGGAPASGLIAEPEGDKIYMGCYDGTARAYEYTPNQYFRWKWTTSGVVTSRPALGSKMLYAGSEDGTLYALDLNDGKEVWRHKTYGYIRGNVAYDNRTVYAASADGSVYALRDLKMGSREEQSAWLVPYATGAAITKSPVVFGTTVMVVNEAKQLHAVNTENGSRQWVVKDVSDVLARGKMNTYCLRDGRYILAVDNVSGDVHWMLDTSNEGIVRFLLNPADATMYLMRADGMLIAVRERQPEAAPKPAPEAAPATPAAPAAPAVPAVPAAPLGQ